MNDFAKKFSKFRKLLSEGQYREIFRRIFYKITSVPIIENKIYSHLRRKYSPLISSHVSANNLKILPKDSQKAPSFSYADEWFCVI